MSKKRRMSEEEFRRAAEEAEDEFNSRDEPDSYEPLVTHHPDGTRIHNSHPTYGMRRSEAERWRMTRQDRWEKNRDSQIKTRFESGMSLVDIFNSGVTGMSLEQLRDFVEFHGFRAVDQAVVLEKRRQLPESISRLLTDDEIVHYGDVTGDSLDVLIDITIAHALKNIRQATTYSVYMSRVVDLLKLKNQISDDDTSKRPIQLNITTRGGRSKIRLKHRVDESNDETPEE